MTARRGDGHPRLTGALYLLLFGHAALLLVTDPPQTGAAASADRDQLAL